MKTSTPIALLLALAMGACASNAALPRQELAPASSAPAKPLAEERRVRTTEVERQAPPAGVAAAPTASIEPSAARPSAPVYRAFVETVEVPAEPAAGDRAPAARPGYDRYDQYVAETRVEQPGTTPFPVNAAVGAGIGAIIGNQSGESGRGALIGTGVGLLFDIGRWVSN